MADQLVTAGDGVRLAVRVHGEAGAPTIVCVHGYPDDASLWDGVVAELGGRFRVVTYDVRGAGRSDKPGELAAYWLDRLADDLADVLDAVSPGGSVHLLAHDWGSIQTWHAVTGDRLRGRVASFTSISGPALDHAGAWFRVRLRRPTPRGLRNVVVQALHSTYIGFFQLPWIPELAWRSGLLPLVMRRMDATAGRPSVSDGVHGLKLYRANMFSRLSRPGPRRAHAPVQVLAPRGDGFVTGPMQTEVERWVSDLWVREVPGGHWLPRANPALVARATAELVEHLEHAGSGGADEPRSLRRARVNPTPLGRFPGNLVVVTGAGSGIGRATAVAFAEQCADVVLADVDPRGLAETAKLVRDNGSEAFEYTVDVSDGAAMESFAEAVRAEHGVPDVVVNNAGVGVTGPLLDTTVEDWERVIDVNLWGVIHGCRCFGGMLAERGEGHVVNVASMAAYTPTRVLPAYSTTKAAVLMLSQCLRAELADRNVGVSALCPGVVRTPITETTRFVGETEEGQRAGRERAGRLYARRNFGPEKVARDVLRAVERDVAIAPSSPEAKAGLVLSRLTPRLLRKAAGRL